MEVTQDVESDSVRGQGNSRHDTVANHADGELPFVLAFATMPKPSLGRAVGTYSSTPTDVKDEGD